MMRTLSETIKDMTIIYDQDCSICEHTLSCNQKEGGCVEKNALYYLKKFQELQEQKYEREEKFNNIVLNQLGNVIITDNLEHANTISKAINNRYKIVTLDGQVVNVGGTITGGSTPTGHNYLKDKYELAAKQQEYASLEEKEKELFGRKKGKTWMGVYVWGARKK